jgi:hypothetical protein
MHEWAEWGREKELVINAMATRSKKRELRQVWTTLEETPFRGADMEIGERREDIGDIKK